MLAALKGAWPGVGISVWLLVVGAGIWCQQGWTRWAATLTSAAFAVGGIYLWVTSGFRWSYLAVAVFGPWGAWQFWRELAPAPASEERPMISLVALLRQPRYLEVPVLAEILKSAWGLDFKVSDEGGESSEQAGRPFIVGESPIFMVNTGDAMFIVHNHAVSYFNEVEDLLEKVHDLRQRKIISDHQAWLSVDCMWADEGAREAQYPRIARAIAELADGAALGLFQPEDNRLIAWDVALDQRLRTGQNLDQFFATDQLPVVRIADDDPRMIAAVAEARRRWPEFVAAFKARQPDGIYSAKAAVTREGNTEFIWMEVIGLEPEFIHGKLANEPVDLGGLKLGDQVEVPVSDLNDWAYKHQPDGEPVGLFTVRVLTETWREQTQDKP